MKDTFLLFISPPVLTPHWSHFLLPWGLLLFAIFRVWRKWPSMRGLIEKKKRELSLLGGLPSETKWIEWKRLCADINAGAKRHTRTAINYAVVLLIGAALGWYAHVWKVRSDYAKDFAAWQQRSAEYQRLFAAWKENQQGELEHGNERNLNVNRLARQ